MALSTLRSQAFCIGTPHFNPTKHINMTHNVSFLAYDELVPYGHFPCAKEGTRLRSQTYVPAISGQATDYLKSQGVDASQPSFELHRHLPELLTMLSQNIFVKESKYRYPAEQSRRLEASKFWLLDLNQESVDNMGLAEFVAIYNDILWEEA